MAGEKARGATTRPGLRLVRLRSATELTPAQFETLLAEDRAHYDGDETPEDLRRRLEGPSTFYVALAPASGEEEEALGYVELDDDRAPPWSLPSRPEHRLRWFLAKDRAGTEMLRLLEEALGGCTLRASLALDPGEAESTTARRLNFWLHRGFSVTGVSYEFEAPLVRVSVEKRVASTGRGEE